MYNEGRGDSGVLEPHSGAGVHHNPSTNSAVVNTRRDEGTSGCANNHGHLAPDLAVGPRVAWPEQTIPEQETSRARTPDFTVRLPKCLGTRKTDESYNGDVTITTAGWPSTDQCCRRVELLPAHAEEHRLRMASRATCTRIFCSPRVCQGVEQTERVQTARCSTKAFTSNGTTSYRTATCSIARAHGRRLFSLENLFTTTGRAWAGTSTGTF